MISSDTTPLSPEAHAYFLTSFTEQHHNVLLREWDGTWVTFNRLMGTYQPVHNQELPTELHARGFLNKETEIRINAGIPGEPERALRDAYEHSTTGIEYLEQHTQLVLGILQRETSTRGQYRSAQRGSLEQLASYTDTPTRQLLRSFADMGHGAAEGEIYNSKKGRWRIIYEDDIHSVPVSQHIVDNLRVNQLIYRNEGNDHWRAEEGYGTCFSLTPAGESLAADINHGHNDPLDARLSIPTYIEYVLNRIPQLRHDAFLVRMLISMPNIALEAMYMYQIAYPHLTERDEGIPLLITTLTQATEQYGGAGAAQMIRMQAKSTMQRHGYPT